MRPLAVCVLLSLVCGCRRASEKKPAAEETVQAPGAMRRVPGRPSSGFGVGAVPQVQSPPGLITPEALAPPPIDCEKLLGADKASAVLGQKVTLAPRTPAGGAECKWVKGPGDETALLHVTVACQVGAVRMFRLIQKKIAGGAKKVELGHIAAEVQAEGRGMVQFVDEESPCAAQVITVPADKALSAAKAVSLGLKALPVKPR